MNSQKEDHLLRLMRTIRQLSSRIGGEISLPLEQRLKVGLNDYQALLLLSEGAAYPSQLTAHLSMPAPSVSRLIDHLVGAGWVTRRLDPTDMRKLRLELTDTGSTIFEQARDIARALVLERYEHLDAQTIEDAFQAVTKLKLEMEAIYA